jgi:hypothetical protein
MNNENFSPQDSLLLIRSMINKTKQGMSDNSIYFLIWGWITFIACTGQFVLKHIYNYEKHYRVWLLVIIGMIFSIYQSTKARKKQKVKTYISDSMKYLWMGMGISYFVLSQKLVGTHLFSPFSFCFTGLALSYQVIFYNLNL